MMDLEETFYCKHEYQRHTHSSSYALVEFACSPCKDFSFISTAEWPTTLDVGNVKTLEHLVQTAVVDTLFCHFAPYAGCEIKLAKVHWDDVRSSQLAFYEATAVAMRELLEQGKWQQSRRRDATTNTDLT
jgi:hypothetical protein